MRDAAINKFLNGLLASFQSRCIDLVEWYVLICSEKRCGLAAPQLVEIRVHTTALNNVPEVKIRLAVPYEVNFFTDQFYIILALLPTGFLRRQAGRQK